MDNRLPIGLFDSGVGGLTVFKAVRELLPNEDLIYLGDTARVPYGTKSRDTIARYTLMAAQALMDCGVKMLVIACNTATSAALSRVREKFAPVPVIGVVEPGARAAISATKKGHIGVIATEATIRGQAYHAAISRLMPGARIASRACTLLVPLAEEGWTEGEIAESVLRRYLGGFFAGESAPDTLLLGCTHFPLFMNSLRKLVGPDVAIVDSATATAKRVAAELASLELARPDANGGDRFLTTDNRERFASSGGRFLGRPLGSQDIELVDMR